MSKKLLRNFLAVCLLLMMAVEKSYASLFQRISCIRKVKLLRHAINYGKGAALKSTLDYWYCYFPKDEAVICVDVDGNHLISDLLKVAQEGKKSPCSLTLGSCSFQRYVPFRSRLGKSLTSFLFLS